VKSTEVNRRKFEGWGNQKRRKNHEGSDSSPWIVCSGSSLSKALDSRRGNRGIARSEDSTFLCME
jgi:hypothetical protein